MFNKSLALPILTVLATGAFIGCAPKQSDTSGSASVVAANLKAVQDHFVPESIGDTGTTTTTLPGSPSSSALSSDSDNDICAGVDFTACQPRLIRTYLLYGRAAVGLTGEIVLSVAQDLAQAPDNSSGTIYAKDKNLTVQFNKRTFLDYDLLILSGTQPVGRVSASPALYDIQLDTGITDQSKPGSRGGKLDIQVKFTDGEHWSSQITVVDLACNLTKPTDPTTARIAVTRNGEMWTGQSMFYSGFGGAFTAAATCNTPSTDNTGVVIYTDFVADHVASKAALYLMKRSETSTATIQNYGFSGLCGNYPDLCQSLATDVSSTPTAVAAYLNTMTNPYCVQRGTSTVTWNSDCKSLSLAVAAQPFLPNDAWITPSTFYQLDVTIPTSL